MGERDEKLDAIDWEELYSSHFRLNDTEPGSPEAKAGWDAKALKFAHKPQRSDYINQLVDILALEDGETVFDMGCGSGTLALPLARQGHDVVAVDFSTGMLGELVKAAEEQGLMSRISVHQRSWQEDFGDLPRADVAVSSRSFVTDDLADGLAKLESRARKRCVLSCGAGDRPYRDARVYAAMGRDDEASVPPRELMILVNYLWSHGRYPRVEYIEYPGIWHRSTREKLVDAITGTHEPQDAEQARRLEEFLDEHVVYDEANERWTMDYARQDRWAVITWNVPR